VSLGSGIAVGVGVYIGAVLAMKLEEAHQISRLLRGRLTRS
jgi:hypothetical protein